MLTETTRALDNGGGLRLLPEEKKAACVAVVTSVLAVAIYITALDLVFRRWLNPDYVAFFTGPLFPRMFITCGRALLEEVEYRLLLMTAIVLVVRLCIGSVPTRWCVAAILLSQLLGVAPWVLSDPLYGTLRYWLVGSVWGWLYWRHGWISAAIGHSTAHLLLDPLLLLALSPNSLTI